MAAATKDRNTVFRPGQEFSDPVAAATKIYAGTIVVLDASGDAEPGAVAAGLIARGIAQETVDNTDGAAGDKRVKVRSGPHAVGNDGTITRADIGKTAYIVDDQTVADNSDSDSRSAAGKILDVTDEGVFVNFTGAGA